MTVVDANVLVSAMVPTDPHHLISAAWLERQYAVNALISAPNVLLAEVAGAIARRTGDMALARRITKKLIELPELDLIVIDNDFAAEVSELAADLCLRGADACYVATAKKLGVALITWDKEVLERATPVATVREPDAHL